MAKISALVEGLRKIEAIHDMKNEDYATKAEPYFNFDVQEYIMGLFKNPKDKPFASMVAIKLARLAQQLNNVYENPNHEAKNEGIDDTFIDMATYTLIWRARRLDRILERNILREKEQKERGHMSLKNKLSDPPLIEDE